MTIIITIAQIIFVLSVLGILFIIARKIPALSRLPQESLAERLSFGAVPRGVQGFIKKLTSTPLFQNIFIKKLEKFLRKFKILALKTDNTLTKFIKKLRKHSENSKGPGDNEMPM